MRRRKQPEAKKPIAIYCRVSSHAQAEDGISLEHQAHVGDLLCQAHFPGHETVVLQDVYTGRKASRPGYKNLVGLITSRQIQSVIAWDHSRLCRNTGEFQRFLSHCENSSVSLVLHNLGVCSFTAVGRLVLSLLGTVAEFESAQLGERMKQFHRKAYEERRLGPGKRPFGWEGDGDGFLVEVPAEQQIIDMAIFGREKGRTWRELAEEANAIGIRSVEGNEFTAQSLYGCIQASKRRREDYSKLSLQARDGRKTKS